MNLKKYNEKKKNKNTVGTALKTNKKITERGN
jgi:hypothetical protein